MSAIYSEILWLAMAVITLIVAAGVALWTREIGHDAENVRPITLSQEVRDTLLRARQASMQKAVQAKQARKAAKVSHRRALREGSTLAESDPTN